MDKVSLKRLIIGCLALLVVIAIAGGVYIWSNQSLVDQEKKTTTNTQTTTKKSDEDGVTVTTQSTKSVPVTSEMLGANGEVDLSKVK